MATLLSSMEMKGANASDPVLRLLRISRTDGMGERANRMELTDAASGMRRETASSSSGMGKSATHVCVYWS